MPTPFNMSFNDVESAWEALVGDWSLMDANDMYHLWLRLLIDGEFRKALFNYGIKQCGIRKTDLAQVTGLSYNTIQQVTTREFFSIRSSTLACIIEALRGIYNNQS